MSILGAEFFNQRLYDLVRQMRGELYMEGLITEEEFAALAADHEPVQRLEDYDVLRAQLNAIYDAMGLGKLDAGDRSLEGVQGYVKVQANAIRLQKERADEAELKRDEALGQLERLKDEFAQVMHPEFGSYYEEVRRANTAEEKLTKAEAALLQMQNAAIDLTAKLQKAETERVLLAPPGANGWNVIDFGPPGPVGLTTHQREQVKNELRRKQELEGEVKQAEEACRAHVCLGSKEASERTRKVEMVLRECVSAVDHAVANVRALMGGDERRLVAIKTKALAVLSTPPSTSASNEEGRKWAHHLAGVDLPDETYDRAMKAVKGIIEDLSDRRSLRQAWQSIDLVTRVEIEKTWANIVKQELTP